MKILFVVTGIGYGDATREHANIEAIKKKYPKAKILVAGYDNSLKYFQDKYNTIKIRGYKLPGKSLKINIFQFGLKNLFLPALWFLGIFKVRLKAFNFIPDLVISDFEPIGISLAAVLKKDCIVVFGFDPVLYREYCKHHKLNYKMLVEAKYFEKLYDRSEIVVIPTFGKRSPHLLYSYINPIVRIKPENLPSEKDIMNELSLVKKPILVMLGGSDFGTELALSINKLAPKIKEDFIIFGGNLSNVKFAKNVKYFSYNPNFLKYLKICKGIITLAGHKTLSEALVYKKPILCFPIQDHIEQVLNSYALRDTIMVSHQSSYNVLEKTIPVFLNDIKNIQSRVEKLNLKGNGSDQVVKIIDSIFSNKIKKKGILE